MADVTRRRLGELLRKLFEILLRQPDGMQAKDALAALANAVALTEFEQGSYKSGGRRFEKNVRFATVDCARAGWLLKSKGRWTITDAGAQAFRERKDPEDFYREAVRLYRAWKATRSDTEEPDEESPENPASEKSVSITFEQAEEQAWQEIEQYLKQMQPYDFQDLVASLLSAMGYHVSWIAPPGKDGGIDIIALVDPLGTRPPRIKVQVKRHADVKIAVDGVRSFMAVLGDDDVGLFICTNGFTRDAEQEVRQQESRRVRLIDSEKFVELWIEHNTKLTDEARRRFPLQPIYFLAPDT